MADTPDAAAGAKRDYVRAMHRINFTQFNEAGQKTAAFKALSAARPGRTSAAARGMRVGSTTPTKGPDGGTSPERQAEVDAWKRERPRGGGRGVAAPHADWVAWGSRNPNRASMASKTMEAAKKAKSASGASKSAKKAVKKAKKKP